MGSLVSLEIPEVPRLIPLDTVEGCFKDLEVVGDGNSFAGKCYKFKVAKKEKCGWHTHVCGDDKGWEDTSS
jgi:hypothetical protein